MRENPQFHRDLDDFWHPHQHDNPSNLQLLQALQAVHIDLRIAVGVLTERVIQLSADQSHLDADVNALRAASAAQAAALTSVAGHLTNIEALIAALKQQAPQLNFAEFDQALADAQTVVAQATAVDTQAAGDDVPPVASA